MSLNYLRDSYTIKGIEMHLNEKKLNKNELNKTIPDETKFSDVGQTNSTTTDPKQSSTNDPKNNDTTSNDTSIPFLIEDDDEIQPVIKSNFPSESKINDNSVFHSKIDRMPKKDRIPSYIRNDDNPADVGE